MSPISTTGTSAASAKPMLAMSPGRRLTSAGLPAPSTRMRSAGAASRENAARTEGSRLGARRRYSPAEALPQTRPSSTICAPLSDCGFSNTGFMSVIGSTPQARACNACARPISPPSAATAALFDMFCGLNGRTLSPRLVKARAIPVSSSDLPTSEPVPCSISARVTAETPTVLHQCHCEKRSDEAIPSARNPSQRDCFAALAMTLLSEFDALLGLDPGAKGVLDKGHLGHEIRGLDQLRLGVAAGDDDVEVARLGLKRGHNLAERQIVVAQDDVEFVKQYQPVGRVGDHRLRDLPGGARGGDVAGAVLSVPGEALAHRPAGDEIPKAFERDTLPGRPHTLDELDDPNAHPV